MTLAESLVEWVLLNIIQKYVSVHDLSFIFPSIHVRSDLCHGLKMLRTFHCSSHHEISCIPKPHYTIDSRYTQTSTTGARNCPDKQVVILDSDLAHSLKGRQSGNHPEWQVWHGQSLAHGGGVTDTYLTITELRKCGSGTKCPCSFSEHFERYGKKNYCKDCGVDCLLMHRICDTQKDGEKLRIVNKQLNTKYESRRSHLQLWKKTILLSCTGKANITELQSNNLIELGSSRVVWILIQG